MGKELTDKIFCLCMRNGAEIWLSPEKAELLKQAITKVDGRKFVEIGKEMVNVVEIVAIHSAEMMEEVRKRKNGEWQCNTGAWHSRGKKCTCPPKELGEMSQEELRAFVQ